MNNVVKIAVYDGFDGEVKIIKDEPSRLLVEIIDVVMCYPQQSQLSTGECMWINKDDIYSLRQNNNFVIRRN